MQWEHLTTFVNFNTFVIDDVMFDATLGPRVARPSQMLTAGYSEDSPDYTAVYTGEWLKAKSNRHRVLIREDSSEAIDGEDQSEEQVANVGPPDATTENVADIR